MHAMSITTDIVVYDENRNVLLLAEVKAKEATNASWAAGIRNHIAQRRRGTLPPYFVVVARDTTYIWSTCESEAPPGVQVSTEVLLGEYFRVAGIDVQHIAPSALELAAGMWLRDLTHGDPAAMHGVPPDLARAAENGRIEFAHAA
jgi:hypothetical protein